MNTEELDKIIYNKYFNVEQPTQDDYNLANAYKAGYEKANEIMIEKLENIIHDFVEENFFYYEDDGDNSWGEPHIEYGGEDDDMKKYNVWDISNKLMEKIKKELKAKYEKD